MSILYTECSAGDVETIMSCIATLGEMEYEMGLENLRAVTLGRVSLKSELTESCGA